jgi:hypothetical protein
MDLFDEIICRCSTAHELGYAEDLLKSFAALQKDTSIKLEQPPEMTSMLEAGGVGKRGPGSSQGDDIRCRLFT